MCYLTISKTYFDLLYTSRLHHFIKAFEAYRLTCTKYFILQKVVP